MKKLLLLFACFVMLSATAEIKPKKTRKFEFKAVKSLDNLAKSMDSAAVKLNHSSEVIKCLQ